jgi:transposase
LARRTFAVVDVVELLRHWYAGDGIAKVARGLGLDRKTVRKYVGRAEAAGLSAGGPALSQEEWSARVQSWFPELTDPRCRSSVHGEIAPFHDRIAALLPTTTVATIHQRLRDEQGLAASASSLRRYIHGEFAEEEAAAEATVLRDDPPPGEEAQARLRSPGTLARPPQWRPQPHLGLRNDAVVFPASLLVPGAEPGPARVPARPYSRLCLLRCVFRPIRPPSPVDSGHPV